VQRALTQHADPGHPSEPKESPGQLTTGGLIYPTLTVWAGGGAFFAL
jgi:hypothetical protein